MVERALTIDGWMVLSELEWLYDTARSMPPDAAVVEVGSWKGRSTVAICEGLATCAGARIWAVDTFRGDPGFDEFVGGFDSGRVLAEFRRNTQAYPHLTLLISESTLAAPLFEDASLDWVFIDGNHAYGAVVADILAWAPKLKPGGLISGHDYDHRGVVEAVLRSFGPVSRAGGNIWYTRARPRSPLTIALRKRVRTLLDQRARLARRVRHHPIALCRPACPR